MVGIERENAFCMGGFMGAKEQEIIKKRLLNLSDNERLFRINAGMAWVANKKNTVIKKDKITGSINVYMKCARPFHGAPEGWLDLSGWTEIEITTDMVGKKIAVFTFEEVKATGGLSKMQKKFRDIILRMGGVFRIIHDL